MLKPITFTLQTPFTNIYTILNLHHNTELLLLPRLRRGQRRPLLQAAKPSTFGIAPTPGSEPAAAFGPSRPPEEKPFRSLLLWTPHSCQLAGIHGRAFPC